MNQTKKMEVQEVNQFQEEERSAISNIGKNLDLVVRSLVTLAREILMEQQEWWSGCCWFRVDNWNK